jgi:hypothetical protein
MRRAFQPFLLAAFCLGVSLAAHADTVRTFNLVGLTLQSGATANGSITIDVTNGQYLTGNITYAGVTTYVFDGPFQNQDVFRGNQDYADVYTLSGRMGEDFDIDLPVVSLVGYNGGVICSVTAQCDHYVGGFATNANGDNYDDAITGSLVSSPVREPSSMLLLGTGLLCTVGSVGAVRSRWLPWAIHD